MRVCSVSSVQLILMVAMSGSLLSVLTLPVSAQDQGSLVITPAKTLRERLSSLEQLHNRTTPQQNKFEQPATTVTDWIAQIEASLVQITGVRVETTETGVEIVLEASSSLEVPATRVEGNTLIANIPNAVLVLPQGDEFSQANAIAGITLVSVTSLPDGQVQVAITGTDAPPVVEVTTEAQGLVLAVTPDAAEAVAEDDAIPLKNN